MLVREIMTAPAVSIHADAALDDAIELLAGRRITLLPVVDDAEHLVGVISEIDVLRRAVQPDGRARVMPLPESEPIPPHITDIMTKEPHTTTEGADVADLVDVFVSTSIKSLPVVRGEKLIGIVSRSDIIRAFWRSDDDLRDDLVAAFADYGQQAWSIRVTHGVVTIGGTGSARERDVAVAIARSVLGVRRVQVEEAA
ncbi:CBS domain-containing protein [Mobilicoccus caccae]|uniref:CBS domain-containing protein n=1 Tax=Mobilicoccus caccae TaxID=1859295 RepID=A0ABQ6IX69_9MICO|nr:CBS domain-containing protein [Mobilicoccus caccae]GMA41294.1 CBS domain-containing protein [Mobilicoccus caccae]